MQETVEIEYTPYRSEKEPVTEVITCKVILHKDFFESVQYYKYIMLKNDVLHEDTPFKQAIIQRRTHLTLTRATYEHPESSDIETEGVGVNDGEFVLFRFETAKEADKFYSKLRNWLLNS